MTQKATEKIMEALSQLLEGFAELQDVVETEMGVDPDDVDEDESDDDAESESLDPDTAMTREVKSAIEGAMESDDYTPEEVANLIAALTEALEEIDPNIFQEEEEEVEEDEEYDDEDDLDFDDDEEYEDEDEDDDD